MFMTIKLFAFDLRSLFRKEENLRDGPLGFGDKAKAVVRVLMQVLVTVVVLALSIAVIRDPAQSQDTKELAFSGLGVVVGYWLR
jgi:hypothetical protein